MAKSESDYRNDPTEYFLSPDDTEQAAGDPAPVQDNAAETPLNIPAGYRLVRETKSERMQLLVTPRIKEGIEAAAKREGTSANSLINIILLDYLEGGKQ